MEPQYWQQAWREDRTGFHQSKVNSKLKHLFPALAPGSDVFVPLCGKTLDILWLHQQGYRVFGVELSHKAAEAFFVENALPFRTLRHSELSGQGGSTLFEGTDTATGIRILAGDFFDLRRDSLPEFVGVYDRAALIAMPVHMRSGYVEQLASLLPAACTGLMLTIDYDQKCMNGPPFAAPDTATRALLMPHFAVEVLLHDSGPDKLGNLAKRGLDTLDEYAYLLTRLG